MVFDKIIAFILCLNLSVAPANNIEMHTSLCSVSKTELLVLAENNAIVSKAREYIGKMEYDLIGGSTSLKKGVGDCSGFVYRIFEACGMKNEYYPRYFTCKGLMEKVEQGKYQEVPLISAKSGDVIIYENSDSYIETHPDEIYGHMGIYSGNGNIIHLTRDDRGYTGCVETPVNYRNLCLAKIHVIRIIPTGSEGSRILV